MADLAALHVWHVTQITFGAAWCAATAALLLRLWVRAKMIRRLAGDDVSLIVAWVFFTVALFCSVSSGVHMTFLLEGGVPPASLGIAVKYNDFAYTAAVGLIKLSLMPSLLELHNERTSNRQLLWVIAVVIIISTVAQGMSTLLTCGATADLMKSRAECPTIEIYGQMSMACIIVDAVTSAGLTFFSIYALVKARVALRVKLATSVAIFLGFAAIIGVIGRIAVLLGSRLMPSQTQVLTEHMLAILEVACGMSAVSLFQSYPAFRLAASGFRSNGRSAQHEVTRTPEMAEMGAAMGTQADDGDTASFDESVPVGTAAAGNDITVEAPTPTPSSSASDDEDKRLGA